MIRDVVLLFPSVFFPRLVATDRPEQNKIDADVWAPRGTRDTNLGRCGRSIWWKQVTTIAGATRQPYAVFALELVVLYIALERRFLLNANVDTG